MGNCPSVKCGSDHKIINLYNNLYEGSILHLTIVLKCIKIFFNKYYYNIKIAQEYLPRAILVDSDTTSLNSIVGGGRLCGNGFRPENVVGGRGGSESNWAKWHYDKDDDKMLSRVLDVIRWETEKCDRLQGFQIVHSLGGGTGSGLGTQIMENVRQEFPKRTINTFSVVPSAAVSAVSADCDLTATEAVESYYNAALSMARLIDGADNTYFADNRALYDTCTTTMGMGAPAYADLNHLVSQTMSGVTTGLRFNANHHHHQPDADMRKSTANLVPFARLHFFSPGFAPLTYRGQTDFCAYTMPELAGQLFTAVSSRPVVDNHHGKTDAVTPHCRPAAVTMAAVMTFRGKDLQQLYEDVLKQTPVQRWLPNNVKTAIYDVPSRGLRISGTVVANTTTVSDVFDRIYRRYNSMLSKKTFLHLYTKRGMPVGDFQKARDKIESLMTEYRSIEENLDDDVVLQHSSNDDLSN